MSKILGIDLGTTNCCVAVVEGATPQVICNREGSRSLSSVKPTIEGVVRLPSRLAITWGLAPSTTATQQLVVPRSMPRILLMTIVRLDD